MRNLHTHNQEKKSISQKTYKHDEEIILVTCYNSYPNSMNVELISHKNGESPPQKKNEVQNFPFNVEERLPDVNKRFNSKLTRKKEGTSYKQKGRTRQLTKMCIIILPSSNKKRKGRSAGFGCTEMNSLQPPFSSLVLLLLVT